MRVSGGVARVDRRTPRSTHDHPVLAPSGDLSRPDRADHLPHAGPGHRPELPRPRHRRAAAHGDAAAGHPLYVADRTGSFASGGLAVAALSIGGGLGGPLVGAAATGSASGPSCSAPPSSRCSASSASSRLSGLDSPALTLVLAAVIGLANPQAGAMARTRWAATARRRPDRHSFTATAMAYEGAVDESSFVAGPVLVSTIAALASPTVGLLLALLVAVVAQGGFGLHHSALPGRSRRRSPGRAPDAVRCRGCTWPGCCWRWPRSASSSAPRRPAWPRGSTASAATS